MVDIGNIGKSLNLDNISAAGAAQSAGVFEKKKMLRKRPAERGLGLEDIPEQTPYVPVQDAAVHEDEDILSLDDVTLDETDEAAEAAPVYSEEENTQMLARIDYELAALQATIKKVLSKKIALADKNDTARHRLLVSAFEDCKNAYAKIREVRDYLG